jgi:hypothetical protein
MKKTMAIWAAALTALACAGPLRAHHSGSIFDTTAIWIKGTVVRFERINPHTITTLEERSEDGQTHRWAVEGPGQSQLDRSGSSVDDPKVGDVIEACAFAYKPAAELSRMFPGVDFSNRRRPLDSDGSPLQFVTGLVLVMPDGQKQLWDPHGNLGECVRSAGDQRQSWLDFLNTSPRAREVWCDQRSASIKSTASPRPLVEEINSSMASPCE